MVDERVENTYHLYMFFEDEIKELKKSRTKKIGGGN